MVWVSMAEARVVCVGAPGLFVYVNVTFGFKKGRKC